ncbi:MAG: exodeoxyribonuclease III [Bdellovibrionales bacterium]|nr:exodeoxyribonuclease III [Bdellovibrionales bacterium]
MKLASWNVNGVRSCARYGLAKWFDDHGADVVCLQEIKAQPDQLTPELRNPGRYNAFWHPAEKPGYSGVAIFSKKEPLAVRYGLGKKEFDREGRILAAEFSNFTVVSAYFPNSQRDHARLGFKLKFCETFAKFCARERENGKTLLLCGDWNIAHTEIDLRNPKSNMKNAGFLPEERAWLTRFLKRGYVDAFRHFTPDPNHYTWWSYRPGVRERNVGWRLDYFLADEDSKTRLTASTHHTHVMGSDHCPVALEIKS